MALSKEVASLREELVTLQAVVSQLGGMVSGLTETMNNVPVRKSRASFYSGACAYEPGRGSGNGNGGDLAEITEPLLAMVAQMNTSTSPVVTEEDGGA